MSQYYTPQRVKNLYQQESSSQGGQAFKLSRSKLDLFIQCPRCFYYDRKLGIGRPPGFPFALNSAVDTLLKKEFDIHRAKNQTHPLIQKYGVDARPVAHEDLDKWRHNFTGIQYLHEPTNLLITGAIDDLWVTTPPDKGVDSRLRGNDNGGSGNDKEGSGNNNGGKFEPEYIVVDYKSTSKEEEITELNKDWQDGYKRQMEIYQWLLRQNGYKVSDTGYFVYCNGKTDCQAFDGRLEFDVTLIPYKGSDKWVEKVIMDAHKCLNSDKIPKENPECDYCNYIEAINSKV